MNLYGITLWVKVFSLITYKASIPRLLSPLGTWDFDMILVKKWAKNIHVDKYVELILCLCPTTFVA